MPAKDRQIHKAVLGNAAGYPRDYFAGRSLGRGFVQKQLK